MHWNYSQEVLIEQTTKLQKTALQLVNTNCLFEIKHIVTAHPAFIFCVENVNKNVLAMNQTTPLQD